MGNSIVLKVVFLLPGMNDQDNKKDYTQVLLEDLRDQFKAFGEGQDMVSGQVERVVADLQEVKIELDTVSRQTEENGKHFEETNQRLERIEYELQEFRAEFSLIHKEIGELRTMLSAKADLARLEAL